MNPRLNSDLDPDPMVLFAKWYEEAVQAKIKNPDAMTLATASKSGVPSARVVLFKGTHPKGLKFFTNFQSRKGKELESNPNAALVFYWAALDRQIRIEGKVEMLTQAESDEYWNSRPRESRLSALASPQSSIISGREVLETQISKLTRELEGKEVLRPSHWGGYCLIPSRFEFWIAGDFRFHERYCYTRKGKLWEICQLAP